MNAMESASALPPLQALNPVKIVPEWRTKHGEMVAALKRIECVDITSTVTRRGIQSYVIGIYHNTPNNTRIPTNHQRNQDPSSSSASPSSPTRSARSREPDARMERRFAEFAELQSQLQHRVHVAHGMMPCEFCLEIASVYLWGHSQRSALSVLAIPEEELMEAFTKYINAITKLVRSRLGSGRPMCSAQERIPQMLHDFLLQEQPAP